MCLIRWSFFRGVGVKSKTKGRDDFLDSEAEAVGQWTDSEFPVVGREDRKVREPEGPGVFVISQ